MEMDQGQAREILGQVRQAARDMQAHASYAIAGPILALWGAIWITCFTITQFAPANAGWGWLAGNAFGLVGSYLASRRRSPVADDTELSRRLRRKLFVFWLALFVFGDIWLALLWPWTGAQLGVFAVTLVMFAYIVMGLWLDMPFLAWLGVLVTILAAGGYVGCLLAAQIRGYLNLWVGLTGGGALLAAGIYLMRRWR